MSINRRSFLLLAANDAHVYEGPGKRTFSELGYAEDSSAEKRTMPVPVGAGSPSAFLRRCVGCLKCVSACPSAILRPSTHPRHFGRPALDFRFGWCRPECNACAEACPAGAVAKGLGAEQKMRQRTGIAVWHADRCVAATGKDVCNACTRHCPTQAITLVAREGAAPDAPKVPKVDGTKCMGCGACEYHCPARPRTAMTVEGRDD